MRILQVTPSYMPEVGGVERHVRAISARFVACGHHVTVATMWSSSALSTAETVDELRIRRFRSRGVGRVYRLPHGLYRYIAHHRTAFDVVHVHNYHAAMLPLVAAAQPRRLIATLHLNDRAHSRGAQWLHLLYEPIGRWSVRRADVVVSVSAAERDRIRARFAISPQQVFLIPNGVEAVPLGDNHADVQRDPTLLLVVGRLESYKRVDLCIDALALLPPAYRLVVVGDGPAGMTLRERAELRGVSERTTFRGHVSDEELVSWYQRASLLLSLSTAEAFGLTLLEAVAAGAQVVCSNLHAFSELAARFPEHVTIVPKSGDAHVVASTITAMRGSVPPPPNLDDYSWDRVANRLLHLYRSVQDRPGEQPYLGTRATHREEVH